MRKPNTAQMIQVNAIAMDTIGLKVPQILELLGIEITNKDLLDKVIEDYGNDFYDWLSDYSEGALPSFEGDLPLAIVEDEEVRTFVYDLLMNFYIARMLLIELNSPLTVRGTDPEED